MVESLEPIEVEALTTVTIDKIRVVARYDAAPLNPAGIVTLSGIPAPAAE